MILFLSYPLFARSVPCKMLNVHTFVKEVAKRGLQVAVAGIPKTIDNDIAVKSYQPFPYFVVVRSMHASNVNLKAELQNFDEYGRTQNQLTNMYICVIFASRSLVSLLGITYAYK